MVKDYDNKGIIYLGGTAGNNDWRTIFTNLLTQKGVPTQLIYNPVVSIWDENAEKREERIKKQARWLIYYLGNPLVPGMPISTRSFIQATRYLYTEKERLIIIFDFTNLTGHYLHVAQAARKDLIQDHPDGLFFDSLEKAAYFLLKQMNG